MPPPEIVPLLLTPPAKEEQLETVCAPVETPGPIEIGPGGQAAEAALSAITAAAETEASRSRRRLTECGFATATGTKPPKSIRSATRLRSDEPSLGTFLRSAAAQPSTTAVVHIHVDDLA